MMAEVESIERGYLSMLLRLALLALDTVKALLDGRAQCDLALPRLLYPLPVSWAEQRQAVYVVR